MRPNSERSSKAANATSRQPLRAVIISRVKRNPYVELLCQGLSQPDLGIAPEIADHFSLGWMWRQRARIDLVHIHWLELFFTYPSLRTSLKRWLSVMLGLMLARLSGVRIVYTLHNLDQHEGRRRWLTQAANRIMFTLAHGIHVHDTGTASNLARLWRRQSGVHVIPHGSYVSAYPNAMSRPAARESLGLAPEAFIYLFLGRLRPYKGLEELISAFRQMEDPEARLVIAGEAQEPEYAAAIAALAQGDERIRLQLEFVGEDQLQRYFNASDVSVLPYRHVTTSGAAILSFSFGTPILAPEIGCFVELVAQGERGLLYDPDAEDGLLGGLRQIRQTDLAALRDACASFAEKLSWPNIARMHAAVYLGTAPVPGKGPIHA